MDVYTHAIVLFFFCGFVIFCFCHLQMFNIQTSYQQPLVDFSTLQLNEIQGEKLDLEVSFT